jgi:hypothetical protein
VSDESFGEGLRIGEVLFGGRERLIELAVALVLPFSIDAL